MQQESLVVKVLLEGEGVFRERRGVELPEGSQEVRELLNYLYLLTSLNRTWSMYVCVSSRV